MQLYQHPDSFFIDGQWQVSTGPGGFEVLNSSTEERIAHVAEAGAGDMNRAVDAARRAFDDGPWPRMSHDERAGIMRAIADELDKRAEAHATVWAAESGVLFSTARDRMRSIGGAYRFHADLAATYPFVERHDSQSGGAHALLVREPVGVVAAIVPWNAAPGLITNKVAPALLAGCTVVLKASPEAPGSAYILAEACAAAGLPAGVLNVVTAGREVSEMLVTHRGIDKVAFTGSTAAGRRIAAACGERIARVSLELGGKSPALVLDDFDVGQAAAEIVAKATFLTGQACASLTRLIVSRGRHDAFVEALRAEFGKVVVGDAFDPASQMGPLATAHHRERVEGYIEKGRAEGARLVLGGGRPAGLSRGFFLEPTVFAGVDNNQTIAREEIFGPVLSVIPAEDESDAIRLANDTDYGLNATVFTHDVDRAYAVARRIRSGTVGQNSARIELGVAFGGFKQSGLGREGGREGLLAYLETKVVVLDAMPAALAGRFPGDPTG